MNNYIIRATAKNHTIRAFGALTTDMVEKMRKVHDTYPLASAALGRSITAGAMMGIMMKNDNDKLTLKIKGDGTLGNILVVSNAKGIVKGYIDNPHADTILKHEGKIDVGAGVGKNGNVTVIKDLGLRDPYIGSNALVSGEIAEDLTAYFTFSEQQPSAVALGVLVDIDYSIKSSGGFIVQLMPDATEEDIDILESNLKGLKPISTLIEEGNSPEEILGMVLKNLDMTILEKYEVDFECDCCRDRMERALISIGRKDLTEILNEDKKAELNCHFCNTSYVFDENDLKNILNKM